MNKPPADAQSARPASPADAKPADDPGVALDFEPTDFDTARAALDDPPAGVKALADADASFAKMRRPARAGDAVLQPASRRWIESLPQRLRPIHLASDFPRIVNDLCDAWPDASKSVRLLSDLIVDWRGGRRGFAESVVTEVIALRDYRFALKQRGH